MIHDMTLEPGRLSGRHALAAILLAPLLACATSGAKPATAAPPPDRGSQSIEDMLAGRFPGVTVDRTNSGGLVIRIRGGATSFYNGNEPLYIVDEVPVAQGSGGILFLSPYDIEKIEVLKNPSDVAIYGMRGANGVIKVTTKLRGRR